MKKLIALLLALVMVLSLVACANKNEPEKEDEKPSDSAQKPADDKKEEDKKEEDKKEDEKAEEPASYLNELGALPLVTDGSKPQITIGLKQSVKTVDYETNDYTLWLEEQTGVDLTFVYFSSDSTEATNQLNLMVSGGQELPDMLWSFGIDEALMFELGQDGYFLNVDPYFETSCHWFWESFEHMSEDDQNKLFSFGDNPANGEMYAFPHFQQSGGDANLCLIEINNSWLEALELEIPKTVDELYDVLKAFAEEDPNGNGQKDEIPAIGYKGYRCDIIQFIMNAFIYCNDQYFFNAENGTIYAPHVTEEYREGLKYMNKLYTEGLLSPQTFTIGVGGGGDSEMMSLLSSDLNNLGLVGAHGTLTFEQDCESLYNYVAFGPMADATGSGRGGFGPKYSSRYEYMNFITCDAEDPELCFRLFDFMSCFESMMWQRYGEKGVHWEDAPEGTMSAAGNPAVFKIIDQSVYSEQNNICWHDIRNGCTTPTFWCSPANFEGWIGYRSRLYYDINDNYNAAGLPAEVVYKLVYTADELTAVSEIEQPLKDFAAEQRALFITGNLDPNSDSDWETYIANMEAQGLNEWIEIAQAAYDRMNG